MSESTTFWITELKAGNREAAQQLWERYYRRLVSAARKRLNGRTGRAVADENDIAQSAFASFYRAAEQGRFPQLDDSGDLWRLLVVITQRKVNRRVRSENCQKRHPGRGNRTGEMEPVDLDAIAGTVPTPEFCLVALESFRDLVDQLSDATLRLLAVMKMEGYTNEEISKRLDCSLSTVERKLRRIRHEWTTDVAERS